MKNGCTAMVESMPVKKTPYEKLLFQKEKLEIELLDVNNALKLLEENPKVQKILDALSKVRIRL